MRYLADTGGQKDFVTEKRGYDSRGRKASNFSAGC